MRRRSPLRAESLLPAASHRPLRRLTVSRQRRRPRHHHCGTLRLDAGNSDSTDRVAPCAPAACADWCSRPGLVGVAGGSASGPVATRWRYSTTSVARRARAAAQRDDRAARARREDARTRPLARLGLHAMLQLAHLLYVERVRTWSSRSRMRAMAGTYAADRQSGDLAQLLDVTQRVAARAALRARRHDQPQPVVLAQGLRMHAGELGRHRDREDRGVVVDLGHHPVLSPGLASSPRNRRSGGRRDASARNRPVPALDLPLREGSGHAPAPCFQQVGPRVLGRLQASGTSPAPRARPRRGATARRPGPRRGGRQCPCSKDPAPLTRSTRPDGVPGATRSLTGSPPSVGTSIVAPSAASVNVTGTTTRRSSPSRGTWAAP